MAISAIFGRGLVFEQERSASFCMALEAGFINGVFLEQLGACRAMRVVATGAHNLAFRYGMVRDTLELGTLILVAAEADFRLSLLVANLVFCRVDLVAIGASHIVSLVCASIPVGAIRIAFMARQASGGSFCYWRGRIVVKGAIWFGPVATLVVGMSVTRAVAIGATRSTIIAPDAVLGRGNIEHGFFIAIMTSRTLCIAIKNEILIACRRGLGRYRNAQCQCYSKQRNPYQHRTLTQESLPNHFLLP